MKRSTCLFCIMLLFCTGLNAGNWGLGITGYLEGENELFGNYVEDHRITTKITIYGIVPLSDVLQIEPGFTVYYDWVIDDYYQTGYGFSVGAMFKLLSAETVSFLTGPRLLFFGRKSPVPIEMINYLEAGMDVPVAFELSLSKRINLRVTQSIVGAWFLIDTIGLDADQEGMRSYGLYLANTWNPSFSFNFRF